MLACRFHEHRDEFVSVIRTVIATRNLVNEHRVNDENSSLFFFLFFSSNAINLVENYGKIPGTINTGHYFASILRSLAVTSELIVVF